MGVRKELLKTVQTMGEEDLEELLKYARWLQADKEELTPEECRELEEAKAEAACGEVASWRATR